jgi:hypothetical protein
MSAVTAPSLASLAHDMEQGRPLSCQAVAQLLGLSERNLHNAARIAYPLTAPEQAVQLTMREVVMLLLRQAAQGRTPSEMVDLPLEDNLVWRLLQRPDPA